MPKREQLDHVNISFNRRKVFPWTVESVGTNIMDRFGPTDRRLLMSEKYV